MELKPIAERTNLPLIAAFIVWVLAILMLAYSSTAYFMLTAAAIALFLCQLAFNVRLRRAKVS
jgi:hypothetical protein